MKKLFVLLLTVVSIFAFATGVFAKSSFDPVDEPTTPFERIAYYVQDAPDRTLTGIGVNGMTYLISVTDNGIGIVRADDDFMMITVARVSDEIANVLGSNYVVQIVSLFGVATYPLEKEQAEVGIDSIFADAENNGVWFRNGYILYWLPDLDSRGGY